MTLCVCVLLLFSRWQRFALTLPAWFIAGNRVCIRILTIYLAINWRERNLCVACDCKIRYKCIHIRPDNLITYIAYRYSQMPVGGECENCVLREWCDLIMIETSSKGIHDHEHRDSPMEKPNKFIRFRFGGSFTAIRHLIVSFGLRTQRPAPTTLSPGNATRKYCASDIESYLRICSYSAQVAVKNCALPLKGSGQTCGWQGDVIATHISNERRSEECNSRATEISLVCSRHLLLSKRNSTRCAHTKPFATSNEHRRIEGSWPRTVVAIKLSIVADKPCGERRMMRIISFHIFFW